MNERRFNPPLWFGLAISLAVHAFILFPALLRMMTTPSSALALTAQFDPEDVQPPAPATEPEIKLGIDNGTPSTLTWLGYREYEQHQAPPSDVEQAAFTDEPSAPSPLSPPTPIEQPSDSPDNQQQPQETSETVVAQAPPTETTAEEPAAENNTGSSETDSDAPQPIEAAPAVVESLATVKTMATSPQRSTTQAMIAFAEHMRRLMETAANAPNIDTASQTSAGSPSETAPQQTPPAPQAAQASTASKPAANPADMDADPSSIVEVPFDKIKLGKPLAAHGLTLRPQRPSFTTLTMMTAAPRNPLAEIQFLSTGSVRDARIIESSSDDRIDRAIEASLFRWRAQGKQLESLRDEQTINIRIRIILNSRPH